MQDKDDEERWKASLIYGSDDGKTRRSEGDGVMKQRRSEKFGQLLRADGTPVDVYRGL